MFGVGVGRGRILSSCVLGEVLSILSSSAIEACTAAISASMSRSWSELLLI